MHAWGARSIARALACYAFAGASACFAPQRAADTVVYASGTDLESANPLVTVHPLSRQVQRYVLFVTLARYDDSLAPSPYLAKDWTWSADHRELTFRLHAGLRWHDGSPTTARDVAFTIDAARDPATGYPRAADLASVEHVTAGDDSTVTVRFAAPVPSIPLVFCELPIVPAHLLKAVPHREMRRADFNLAPVGNGPFVFVERRAGQQWRFRRNPDFPQVLGGPPRLAGVVVAVVDEPTTKFAGLASNDLDVAGIAPTMASLASRDHSLRVVDYPVLFTTGLFFNVHRAPFDDARVRRAMSLSIDRDRIVRAALAGYGKPAAGPIPPESPYAIETPPVHDTARADSLLDAADWRRTGRGVRTKGGRELAVELLTVGSGDNAIEQLLQADFAERGIRMTIRQVELGTFLTAARAPEKTYDLLLTGIPGDVSLSYVGALFESRQAGGSLDYSGFRSKELDAQLAIARSASTRDDARRAWLDVQQILEREMPVAWIYHARGVQGVTSRLHNVRMDLRGEMPTIAQWTLSDSARVAVQP